VYLDIDGARRLQVAFNITDYVRIRGKFDEAAAEFAYFTSVIYACDRAINREKPPGDRWTREFFVETPVADPDKWSATVDLAEAMLEFLTGDLWHLDFIKSTTPLFGREFKRKRRNRRFCQKTRMSGNTVSLFSGGLDSLIGVIDWLEDNPSASLVLASTYDAQAESARMDQERLIRHLVTAYDGRFQRYVARTGLCSDGEDTNFRSRSLSFIGNAVLAASFLDNNTRILIPENGGIALNFPLTPARRGSLSTRTVHPYFVNMVGKFLAALGFQYSLDNSYLFLTKGEMMQGCKNAALLQAAYSASASCGKRGHREQWEIRRAPQCGACIPCIFRRAAILKAGYSEEQYGYSLNVGEARRRILSKPKHDLSSVIDFIERNDETKEIWRTLRSNGHLDADLKIQYVSLVERLRDEVTAWAQNKGLI
jgi:7-cyano-7-deazaguanine synthase in queuosine biosynthesis